MENNYCHTEHITCQRCGENTPVGHVHACFPSDNVNHPKHYTNSPARCVSCNTQIECIDIVRHLNFNVGNAIKYLWRYRDKGGKEDLQKAIWYITDEIHKL